MAYSNSATKNLTAQLRLKGGVAARTLTGNVTMDAATETICFWDPGGANRDITLPAEETSEGLFFIIKNEADAAENLVVKNDAAGTVVTLNQTEWAIVACDGTTWQDVPISALADYLATANTWTAEQTFGAGIALLDSDTLTFGTGDDLTFTPDGTDVVVTGLGKLRFGDSVVASWGVGDDLTILSDGTDAVLGGAGKVRLADAKALTFGAGDDVSISSDGTNAVMTGAGALLAHDSVFLIADPADTTKRARLDVGTVTAGQTRILTIPDADTGLMGPVYASTAASTAITGATEVKTAFDAKKTLAANTLKAGTVIHIVAQGIHTATTGAETHDMSLEIGATQIVADTAIDAANNDIFSYDVWLTVRTVGVGGTIVGFGRKRYGAVGTAEVPFILASTAIDTTVANDVAVYIDRQAAATDGDSARLDTMVVELSG